VWADGSDEENIHDLPGLIANPDDAVLATLNPMVDVQINNGPSVRRNVVLVAQNRAGKGSKIPKPPWSNFHNSKLDGYARAAFNQSVYYGAFFTDLMSDVYGSNGDDAMEKLSPSHIEHLICELEIMGLRDPLLIALGQNAYGGLDRYKGEIGDGLGGDTLIVQITHFSMAAHPNPPATTGITVDKYRQIVNGQLKRNKCPSII